MHKTMITISGNTEKVVWSNYWKDNEYNKFVICLWFTPCHQMADIHAIYIDMNCSEHHALTNQAPF